MPETDDGRPERAAEHPQAADPEETVWRAEAIDTEEPPPAGSLDPASIESRDDPEELMRRYEALAPVSSPNPAYRRWRNVGLGVLLTGILLTLHAYWATANAVLAGRADAERLLRLGGLELLQGTLGLALVALGGVAAIVFALMPRIRGLPPRPDQLRHQRAAARLRSRRETNRALLWGGLGVLLVGAVIAGAALRRTAQTGTVPGWELGATTIAVHLLGSGILLLGAIVFAAAAVRQGALEDAVVVLDSYAEEARQHQGGARVALSAPEDRSSRGARPDVRRGERPSGDSARVINPPE